MAVDLTELDDIPTSGDENIDNGVSQSRKIQARLALVALTLFGAACTPYFQPPPKDNRDAVTRRYEELLQHDIAVLGRQIVPTLRKLLGDLPTDRVIMVGEDQLSAGRNKYAVSSEFKRSVVDKGPIAAVRSDMVFDTSPSTSDDSGANTISGEIRRRAPLYNAKEEDFPYLNVKGLAFGRVGVSFDEGQFSHPRIESDRYYWHLIYEQLPIKERQQFLDELKVVIEKQVFKLPKEERLPGFSAHPNAHEDFFEVAGVVGDIRMKGFVDPKGAIGLNGAGDVSAFPQLELYYSTKGSDYWKEVDK